MSSAMTLFPRSWPQGSRSDREKVERGDVVRTTIEMERQLASLDLTHVICEFQANL
jgi:hypothetical protein